VPQWDTLLALGVFRLEYLKGKHTVVEKEGRKKGLFSDQTIQQVYKKLVIVGYHQG
jgi:hypothetical protein